MNMIPSWMKFKKQWNLVGYRKKKQETTLKLNEEEWSYLGMLLEKGYPLKDALLVMGILEDQLIERLESGEAIESILLANHTGAFYDHMHFFLKRLSLAKAIQTSIAYVSFEKELKKELLQKSLYPIFIFFLAVGALLVFRTSILPMMISGFASEANTGVMMFILNVLYQLTLVLLIGIVVAVIYWLIHRHIPLVHEKVMKKVVLYIPWAKDYLSYQFCGYLRVLMQEGISTKEVFTFLSKYCRQVLISHCASSIAFQLENGGSFYEAFKSTSLLSKHLLSIIEIGKAVSALNDLLLDFMEQQRLLMQRRMKLISSMIIAIAYGYVAVLVITVYQIMLLPLSLLEQI